MSDDDSTPPLIPLHYMSRRHSRVKSGEIRFVLLCWGVPLVIGLGVAAGVKWLPDIGCMLALVGLLDILAGTICVVLGTVALIVFVDMNWSMSTRPWRQILLPAILLFLLLLSNFLSAAVCLHYSGALNY